MGNKVLSKICDMNVKGSKMTPWHSMKRPALAAYLQQLVAASLKIKGFQLSKR